MVFANQSAREDYSGNAPDRIRLSSKLHHPNMNKSAVAAETGVEADAEDGYISIAAPPVQESPRQRPHSISIVRQVEPRETSKSKGTKIKTSSGIKSAPPPSAGGGRRRLQPSKFIEEVTQSPKGPRKTGALTPLMRLQSTPKAPTGAKPKAATKKAAAAASKKLLQSFRTTDVQLVVYNYLKAISPLPELQEPKHCKIYAEASIEETFYPIVEAHDVIIVAGAYFGDEGKGKTVEAVSRHPKCTCIARVNSGENAGHTVYDTNGRRFVFNLLPSGVLSEGRKSYIGPECVMDPITFMETEVQQLIDAGISYLDRVLVGNVYIVTPYHKLIDLVISEANSSTLKGMAPAHAGKVSKNGIRLDHIFNDEAVLRAQLEKGLNVYLGTLKQKNLSDEDVVKRCEEANSGTMIRVPPYVVNFAKAKDKMGYLINLYRERVRENEAFPKRCDVVREIDAAARRGEKVLLEGPQSFWLSNGCEKFWVSSTSANTSAIGLLAAAQLNFQSLKMVVINVHKAPGSSRVGIGACPSGFVPQDFFSSRNIRTLNELPKNICADFDAIQHIFFSRAFPNVDDPTRFNGISKPIEYTDATGTYNIGVAMAVASSIHHGELGAVTKKPRICGFFDCVLHHEVNTIQGPYLTISALDRADEYDRLGITIAYIYYSPDGIVCDVNGRRYRNGDIIHAGDPVPNESALRHCHPIVKLVNGWKNEPIASTKRQKGAPLPHALCEFLSTIEHFTGCKVLSIGNGPGGDDIIYINQA